jgi:flagellar FliL protein
MADKKEETPEVEGEEGAKPAKKKLSGKALILFIVLPAILLLGGGGAAAYFLVFNKKPAAEATKDAHGKEVKDDKHGAKKDDKKKGDKKAEHGAAAGGDEASGIKTSEGPNGETFLTLPDMVVNISTTDNRAVFLKLRLTLQVKDAEIAEAIKPAVPRIKDQYTGFLRELRVEDVQGSAGYTRLQLELLKRTNLAVAPAHVDAVLIEEILVN